MRIEVIGTVEPPADEGEAIAIEQHDADAGTIGEIFEAAFAGQWRRGKAVASYSLLRDFAIRRSGQLCFALAATAVIGTS